MAKEPFARGIDPEFYQQVQDARAGKPVVAERRIPPLAKQEEWHVYPLRMYSGEHVPNYSKPEIEREVDQRAMPFEVEPILMNRMERIIPHNLATDPRWEPVIDAMLSEARARAADSAKLGIAPHMVNHRGLSPTQALPTHQVQNPDGTVGQHIIPQYRYASEDNGEGGEAGLPRQAATAPLGSPTSHPGTVQRLSGPLGAPPQKFFDESDDYREGLMGDGVVYQLEQSEQGRVREAQNGPAQKTQGYLDGAIAVANQHSFQ